MGLKRTSLDRKEEETFHPAKLICDFKILAID